MRGLSEALATGTLKEVVKRYGPEAAMKALEVAEGA
jgi:hypothetical protein